MTKTELIETKEEYLVTVYTDSTVYDQLYVGKKEDTEKTPVVEGKKSTNGQYIFQFAVSEEKLGSKLQIVPGSEKPPVSGIQKKMFSARFRKNTACV